MTYTNPRLWSIWDIMRTFDASGVLSVMRQISIWSTDGSEEKPLNDDYRARQEEAIKSYEETFIEIGLSASRVTLNNIAAALAESGCTFGDLKDLSLELRGRLVDETKDKVFFLMTLRESDFYNEPRRGWETSISRFPNIVDDVEESSKCLALSRYPAAVFHSIQIVEAALVDLGKFIKVKDPKSGWTAVSGALNKIMKKERKDLTRFERKNYAFLEQVHGTVEALKNAWRNKISHADGRLILMRGEFNPEVAEEVLFATRAFTRRLAEGLPPRA